MLNPESNKDTSEQFVPNSSYLELVQYDSKSLTMTVTFKKGGQHKYLYVYPSTFASFKQSPNHGVYYSKVIKGKLTGVPVQTHDVSTKHKVDPKNKQPRSRPYGSSSINKLSRPGHIPTSLSKS